MTFNAERWCAHVCIWFTTARGKVVSTRQSSETAHADLHDAKWSFLRVFLLKETKGGGHEHLSSKAAAISPVERTGVLGVWPSQLELVRVGNEIVWDAVIKGTEIKRRR